MKKKTKQYGFDNFYWFHRLSPSGDERDYPFKQQVVWEKTLEILNPLKSKNIVEFSLLHTELFVFTQKEEKISQTFLLEYINSFLS